MSRLAGIIAATHKNSISCNEHKLSPNHIKEIIWHTVCRKATYTLARMCANAVANHITVSNRRKSKLCPNSYCSLRHGAHVCDEGAERDKKQGFAITQEAARYLGSVKAPGPWISFQLLITVENLCCGSLWHRAGIVLDPCLRLTGVALIVMNLK